MENFETENTTVEADACGICKGSGVCDMCEGSGSIYDFDIQGNEIEGSARNCTHCTSPGYKMGDCSYCMGTGTYNPAFSNPDMAQKLDHLEEMRSNYEYQYDTINY